MNQQIFAQGIMHVSSAELRTIYALLAETKLTSLFAVKAKELFKKDIDHFNELLQKEIRKLDYYTDDELRLKLFLYFTKVLELKAPDFTNPSAIEAKGTEIILHTHELMLKDKEYEQFVIHAEEAPIERLIVQYQMQMIFSTFDKQFQQLNDADVQAFIQKIVEFTQKLPNNQQQNIKEQLQLEHVTIETIRTAFSTFGTVFVLSIIVEIAGFSAYTSLISAIATSSATLGITTPLSIYTGATSLLLIVSNPLFLVTLAVGGGGLLFYRQSKKLRQSLLPVGVLQLLLPVMLDHKPEKDYVLLTKEWQRKVELQQIYHDKLQAAHSTYELQKATVASLNTKIANNSDKMKALKKDIKDIKTQVEERLTALRDDEKSARFTELTEQLHQVQQEIQQLKATMTTNKEKTGLFKSITGFFDNNAIKSKLAQLEQKQHLLMSERTEAAIEMAPRAFSDELETMKQAIVQIEQLEQSITSYEQEKKAAKKQIEALKTTILELDIVIKKQQKEYYGLSDMPSLSSLSEET